MAPLDPDGRVIGGVSTFLGFVALNAMYIVSVLPVVTIGAATSALLEVTIRFSDDERGRPVADYFPTFARNARAATPVAFALLAPMVALGFASVFWFAYADPWLTWLGVLGVIGVVYLFAAFLHAMALVAVYRDTVRRTLKNALLLPLAEPLRTAGLVVIPATQLALCVVFPAYLVILVTVGVSVGAYISAFLFRGVHARY